MTGNYLEAYEDLLHYCSNYSGHRYDVELQRDFVNRYWDTFCVTVFKFLGVSIKRHKEEAKSKWAELDHIVRQNERKLREGV